MNRYNELVRKIAMHSTHPDPVTGERTIEFTSRTDGSKPETISEEQLQQVEAQLGYVLPEDYREFVRDYGTLMSPVSITLPEPTVDGFPVGLMGVFYGVIPGSFDDLVEANMEEPLLPLGILEIARGDNGLWYLVLEGERKGNVLFWDAGVEGYESLQVVAPTFDKFLRLLARE